MAILEESGVTAPIPIPRLAEELEVQTVSANQMVRKLEEEGLVSYQPYKGVSFTSSGKQAVETIMRNRRLWEVFFVEQLNFTPSEADALACRMEHITEPEVAARLAEYLGHPAASPTGQHIPSLDNPPHTASGVPLTELPTGARAEILAFRLDEAASAYLRSENLKPGALVEVLAVSSSGAVLVTFETKRLSLSRELAVKIFVSQVQENKQYTA